MNKCFKTLTKFRLEKSAEFLLRKEKIFNLTSCFNHSIKVQNNQMKLKGTNEEKLNQGNTNPNKS